MSYNQYPDKDQMMLSTSDNKITIEPNRIPHDCPDQINAFLLNCGWVCSHYDPNTHEPLFQKANELAAQSMYYRWYEAMAYEFWRFVTLNTGNDTP